MKIKNEIRESNGKMVIANKSNDFIQVYGIIDMNLYRICDTLLDTVVSKLVSSIELREGIYYLTVSKNISKYDFKRIVSILKIKNLCENVKFEY